MPVTLGAISLPEDAWWIDEFEADAVAQGTSRMSGGQLLVEETALVKGRPITLDTFLPRSTLQQVHALSFDAVAVHDLVLRDESFRVMFQRPNPIRARAMLEAANPLPDDYYAVTIRLFEVDQ